MDGANRQGMDRAWESINSTLLKNVSLTPARAFAECNVSAKMRLKKLDVPIA